MELLQSENLFKILNLKCQKEKYHKIQDKGAEENIELNIRPLIVLKFNFMHIKGRI